MLPDNLFILCSTLALIGIVGFLVATTTKVNQQVETPASHFRYVDFDGHQYVLYSDEDQSGLAHSPKCKCLLLDGKEKGNAE